MKKFIYVFIALFIVCTTVSNAESKKTRIKNLTAQCDSLTKDVAAKDSIINVLLEKQALAEQEPEESLDGFVVIPKSRIANMSIDYSNIGDEIRAYGVAVAGSEMSAINHAYAEAAGVMQKMIEQYVKTGFKHYNNSISTEEQSRIDAHTQEQVILACKGINNGITEVDHEIAYNRSTRRYRCEICVRYNKKNILNIIEQHNVNRIINDELQFETELQDAWTELDNNRKAQRIQPSNVTNVEPVEM